MTNEDKDYLRYMVKLFLKAGKTDSEIINWGTAFDFKKATIKKYIKVFSNGKK